MVPTDTSDRGTSMDENSVRLTRSSGAGGRSSWSATDAERDRELRAVTFFCARAVGCSCPWGALARYPSVPAPCPCPLPFGARPMLAPFCGRYSFATRSRCVLLLVQLLVPRRAPTRRLPLPALCSYPFATRARPMPVPSHCPCPRRARAPTPPFARSRSCACATTRPRARAMARGPRAATF